MLVTRNEFENLDQAPWDAPYWEDRGAFNPGSPKAGAELRFLQTEPGSGSPSIRPRLHALCALYAHSRQLDQRLRLLEDLEALILQQAQILAAELLEGGGPPRAPVLV